MVGRSMIVLLAACGLLLASPGCGDATPKRSTKKTTSNKKKAPVKEKAPETVPDEKTPGEDEKPEGGEDDE